MGWSTRRGGSTAFCVTDAPRLPPEPRSPRSLPGCRASGAAAAAAASALPARPTSARPFAGSQWGRPPRRGRAVREPRRPPPPAATGVTTCSARSLPAGRREGARCGRTAAPLRFVRPLAYSSLRTPAGSGATTRSPSPASTPTATSPPSQLQGQRGEALSSRGVASRRPRRAAGRRFSSCHGLAPRGGSRPTATSPPLGAPGKFLIYFRLRRRKSYWEELFASRFYLFIGYSMTFTACH